MTLLLVQAGGWLVAWVSVGLMGCLALYNLVHFARATAGPRPIVQKAPVQTVHVTNRVRPAKPVTRPPERPATLQAPVPRPQPPQAQPPVQERRPRVTTRLPASPQAQPPAVPRRPRVTTRLPESPQIPPARPLERPTWYGDAVWNRVAVFGLTPNTPPPVTEPLPIDQIETQEYLYALQHPQTDRN